jgi:hypothetical protein
LTYQNNLGQESTVYLAVDGAEAPQPETFSVFDLVITASYVGLPPAICEPSTGIAIPVALVLGENSLEGNLFGQDNHIEANPCCPSSQSAGEVWYALGMDPNHTVIATVQPTGQPPLDLALWLFDACGSQYVCHCADADTAGASEELIHQNTAENAVTMYLAVDADQPASQETGGFSLTLFYTENVPAERKSLGGIKALYR